MIKLNKFLMLMLTVVLFTACGEHNDLDDGEDEGKTEGNPNKVTVQNEDFEQPIDFQSGTGGWQRRDFHNASKVKVEYSEGSGVNSSNCIKITAYPENGAASVGISQKLKGLTPGTLYRMYAKIKTSDVSGGRGAVLFDLSSDQYWNASKFLYGTNLEWKTVYTDFLAQEDGTAEIVCSLGFRLGGTSSGGFASGVVWYDNVYVVKVSSEMFSVEGEHVCVYLEPSHVLAPQGKVVQWISNLDKIYNSYVDLIGDKPVKGNKLVVLSTQGIESGYWALAGYPILWSSNYDAVKSSMEQIDEYGNWVFGVMHEMGHVFNGGNNFVNGNYNSNWNWNDEIFANFRMYYAIIQNNATVYLDGALYVGDEIDRMYKSVGSGCYDNTLGAGKTDNGNGIMWTLVRLSKQVGWDVFKKTFRELYTTGRTSFSNNWDRYDYFLTILSKYADQDVRVLFPEGELNLIKSGYNQ
ncbi:MAG: hypothetical protein AB2L24_28600 [Mangrovibacterium sp.]